MTRFSIGLTLALLLVVTSVTEAQRNRTRFRQRLSGGSAQDWQSNQGFRQSGIIAVNVGRHTIIQNQADGPMNAATNTFDAGRQVCSGGVCGSSSGTPRPGRSLVSAAPGGGSRGCCCPPQCPAPAGMRWIYVCPDRRWVLEKAPEPQD